MPASDPLHLPFGVTNEFAHPVAVKPERHQSAERRGTTLAVGDTGTIISVERLRESALQGERAQRTPRVAARASGTAPLACPV